MGEENSASVLGCGLKDGGGKLEDFGFMDDLVDARATLFADSDTAHERGESFIARLGR